MLGRVVLEVSTSSPKPSIKMRMVDRVILEPMLAMVDIICHSIKEASTTIKISIIIPNMDTIIQGPTLEVVVAVVVSILPLAVVAAVMANKAIKVGKLIRRISPSKIPINEPNRHNINRKSSFSQMDDGVRRYMHL